MRAANCLRYCQGIPGNEGRRFRNDQPDSPGSGQMRDQTRRRRSEPMTPLTCPSKGRSATATKPCAKSNQSPTSEVAFAIPSRNLAPVIIRLPSLLFLFLPDSDACQALGWERTGDGTWNDRSGRLRGHLKGSILRFSTRISFVRLSNARFASTTILRYSAINGFLL